MSACSSCPVCRSQSSRGVLDLGEVPACLGAPVAAEELGKEPLGLLRVVECLDCGHLFNEAADAEVIARIYDAHYSSGFVTTPAMQKRLDDIAAEAFGHDLDGAVVVEVGAGDLSFSRSMLARGAARVIAYEPSRDCVVDDEGIEHRQRYFDASELEGDAPRPSVIVMRHVLEHMLQVDDMLDSLVAALPPQGLLYVEVPDADDILRCRRIFDFCYEHVSYFSPALLAGELKRRGLEIVRRTAPAGGQHFGLTARRIGETPSVIDEGPGTRFDHSTLETARHEFAAALNEVVREGGRCAIYGAGAHAIDATVIARLGADQLVCMFDRAPQKEGRFTPASHVPIRIPTPESLADIDTVIVIASLHQDAIVADLRAEFGFSGSIWGTHPRLARV